MVERVYLGTTTQLIVRARAGRAGGGARAEHRTLERDDRWSIGERIKIGWHPEHALVLR